MYVRSAKEQLRNRFGAAVAEVDHHDVWQRARLTGAVDAGWVQARLRLTPPTAQRVVRVTEAVVAKSTDFRFLVPISGLGVVERAGTPIAQDGDQVWVAPYDQTVLVMPSMTHLRPGNTQVRLGRFVEP